MKLNRKKFAQLKENTDASIANTETSSPSKPTRSPKRPPKFYEVVLLVDPLAANHLTQGAVKLEYLLIRWWYTDDTCKVYAKASRRQLVKLASWAAQMETLVSVRWPVLLRDLVDFIEGKGTKDTLSLNA